MLSATFVLYFYFLLIADRQVQDTMRSISQFSTKINTYFKSTSKQNKDKKPDRKTIIFNGFQTVWCNSWKVPWCDFCQSSWTAWIHMRPVTDPVSPSSSIPSYIMCGWRSVWSLNSFCGLQISIPVCCLAVWEMMSSWWHLPVWARLYFEHSKKN